MKTRKSISDAQRLTIRLFLLVAGILAGGICLAADFPPGNPPAGEVCQSYNETIILQNVQGEIVEFRCDPGPCPVIPGLSFNFNTSAGTCTISGTPTQPGDYDFTLLVEDENPPNTKDYTITINNISAGADQYVCGTLTTGLSGQVPASGTGTWSKYNGSDPVNYTDLNAADADVTVPEYGTYEFIWTIDNGCIARDTVKLVFAEAADAGLDQYLCNTLSTTLDGNVTSAGEGTWTVTGSPPASATVTIDDPAKYNTGITVDEYGTYEFQWKIDNTGCSTQDQVSIYFAEEADAGPDRNYCATLSATLEGNNPSAGTGTWTVTGSPPASATVTIDDPAQYNTGITVDVYGTYELQWEIDNTDCSTQDQVTLSFAEAADAGSNQFLCNTLNTTLEGNNPSAGTGTWTVTGSPPASATVTIDDPAQYNTGITVDVYGTYELQWEIDNTDCSTTDVVSLNFIDNPRIDLELVLDLSNSMGWPACAGCTETKLDKLQQAVGVFLQTYQVLTPPYDRVGVVYFQTNVDYSESSLQEFTTGVVNGIESDVNGKMDGGWTAMGGGLQVAIDTLLNNDIGNNRNIILITDGAQNVNPMVDYINYEITNKIPPPAGGTSNIVPHSPDPLQISGDQNIRIFTIGINANGSYENLLVNLAGETGGIPYLTSEDNGYAFGDFLTQSFIELLRCGSPQLIDYRHNSLTAPERAEIFGVDAGSDRIILRLTGNKADVSNLRFNVRKDDVILTPEHGQIIDGESYRIFTIDLPYDLNGRTINAEGDWEMLISGSPGMEYQASAIVDNHALYYETSVSRGATAGGMLSLDVLIRDQDIAVNDASVTATIYKPMRRIDKILALTSVKTMRRGRVKVLKGDRAYISELKQDRKKFTDVIRAADIKRRLLLGNERISGKLDPVPVTVALHNEGEGLYTAQFGDTRVPGTYKVVYTIEGPKGNYRRQETKTVQLGLGPFSRRKSRIRFLKEDTRRDLPMRIFIRPKDEFGNLLGTGYAEMIEVNSDYYMCGQAVDQLDGSYVVPVYPKKGIGDADVQVAVSGNTVYQGKISGLRKWIPFWIRRHLAHIIPEAGKR